MQGDGYGGQDASNMLGNGWKGQKTYVFDPTIGNYLGRDFGKGGEDGGRCSRRRQACNAAGYGFQDNATRHGA